MGVARGCSVPPRGTLSRPMVLLGARGFGPKWTYSPSVRLAANMLAAVDRQVALGGPGPSEPAPLSTLYPVWPSPLQGSQLPPSPRLGSRHTQHVCHRQLICSHEPQQTFLDAWALARCWGDAGETEATRAGLTEAPWRSHREGWQDTWQLLKE